VGGALWLIGCVINYNKWWDELRHIAWIALQFLGVVVVLSIVIPLTVYGVIKWWRVQEERQRLEEAYKRQVDAEISNIISHRRRLGAARKAERKLDRSTSKSSRLTTSSCTSPPPGGS
jgi:hypothetical protein